MKTLYFAAVVLLLFVVAAGQAQQNINIGFTVSKTGALNVDSLEQYRGFELWRDQVNAAGGIKAGGKSYKVQFVSYDDESNVKRVQQLYSRMILQDNADFPVQPVFLQPHRDGGDCHRAVWQDHAHHRRGRGQDLHAGQSLPVPDVRSRHGIPKRRAGHAEDQRPEGNGRFCL